LATRPSQTRPGVGIIRIRSRGFNQRGVIVIEFERSIMIYRRGYSPERQRPSVEGK
jgi:acyl dehydratase